MKHIAITLVFLATPALADTSAGVPADHAQVLNAPYITGSHYSARDLVPTWVDEVGQPVTSDRIEAIARRVEQLYQRDGYLVPLIVPGDGDGATPHLHVFEARVAEVRVRGDAGAYRDAVAAVAARLEAQPVLHKAFTQRAIHELEDLPGLSVEAGFAPHDDDPNAFELTLDVGYERTDGLLSFSSRVSDDIGDGLLSARVGFNSAFGTGERLTLTAASSTTFGVYTYFGGRVERRFGLLDVDVSGSLADADIGTDSNYDAARLALELSTAMRRGSLVVRPLVALSMRNAEDRDDAGAAWEITRTRSIEAGVELTHRRETGITQLRIGTEQGIDDWNARTYLRYGAAPDLTFTKTAIDISHTRVLAPGWQLRAAAEGQWTGADLPSGERFTFGGAQFGRAFDPGVMISDRGAAASLQLDRSQRWNGSLVQSGRIYLQADYGIAEDNGPAGETLHGASTTLGLSARTHALTTTLEAGYALDTISDAAAGSRLRAFLGTQYRF